MQNFFDNILGVIDFIIAIFAEVTSYLITNPIFQIVLGIFILITIVNIIVYLLNRGKDKEE